MMVFNYFEKFLLALGLSALICSVYFLRQKDTGPVHEIRREMPLGRIHLHKGDTRWKALSQANHFKTWEKQRLYVGDSLYAGASSRLSFYVGTVHVDLKPHTKLLLTTGDERFVLETSYGQFEMHLPPGERMRVSAGRKFLDLASVNGGRVSVQIEDAEFLRVQNMAGDLVVRTEGKVEYTIPEEQIFRAKNQVSF